MLKRHSRLIQFSINLKTFTIMKAKRLLFFVMAICLVSGVKAQFYDSADDIYYYVEYKDGNLVTTPKADVLVFNFDGRKAALLNRDESLSHIPEIAYYSEVCDKMRSNINYYEERVENVSYNVYYDSSKQAYCIEFKNTIGQNLFTGAPHIVNYDYQFTFSSDREFCYLNCKTRDNVGGPGFNGSSKKVFKKVSKSYFKSGRSRTPSGSLYE